MPTPERRALRAERSRVIADDLRDCLSARLRPVSAKGKLSEAIRHALSRWDGLSRFLNDSRSDLESNTVERTIGPIVLNRKRCFVRRLRQGGDNWAVIATLIENCELSGINPYDSLTSTLTEVANGHPASDDGSLMLCTAEG